VTISTSFAFRNRHGTCWRAKALCPLLGVSRHSADGRAEYLSLVERGHSHAHKRAMREVWTDGYSPSELDAAQERYGLRFPPDLVELLLDRRPIQGWDWRTDHDGIRRAMQHPLNGLLFDLEHNGLWWPEWGERPSSAEERAEVLTSAVDAAPRLVPLIGHRYIPEEPHKAGNPVFSVMQSDVIYYGANLAEFLDNHFGGTHCAGSTRHIPFWSEMVERIARPNVCYWWITARPFLGGRQAIPVVRSFMASWKLATDSDYSEVAISVRS